MNRLKDSANFDADNFIRTSLSAALNVASEANLRETLTSEQFYKRVAEKVHAQTDMPEELFYHLSHPIHWTLFPTIRDDGYDSPLKLVQMSPSQGAVNHSLYVVVGRKIIEGDLMSLTDYALKEYSNLTRERAEKFAKSLNLSVV